MTPDGLAALAEVRRFLAREVLPTVPPPMAGELRAAIKVLETVADELNALHPLLRSECRELLALALEACPVLRPVDAGSEEAAPLAVLAERLATEDMDTRTLLALHEEVLDTSSVLVAALQRHVQATSHAVPLEVDGAADPGHTLLLRFYQTLGRHATRRVSWQSVFPRTTRFGETPHLRHAQMPPRALGEGTESEITNRDPQ